MMYTTRKLGFRHGFHEDGFHTGIHAAKLALGDHSYLAPGYSLNFLLQQK